MKKVSVKYAVLVAVFVLGSVMMFGSIFASEFEWIPDIFSNAQQEVNDLEETPDIFSDGEPAVSDLGVIRDIFPDLVLANLVAVNLNMNVDSVVTDAELLSVLVLNFNPDERVSDFTGIDRLQGLEHLYVDYHGLDSLELFAGLTNLRVLNVEGNEISDLSPLAGMANLETVRVGGNPISNVAGLTHLTELKTLSLFETNVSDLSDVSSMNQLEVLEISNIDVSVSDINGFSQLTNLRVLNLSDVEIDDISFVSELTLLEDLILFNNGNISDLTPLSNLTGLTHLEVVNSRVEDIAVIGNLENLEILSLSGNYIEDVSSLEGLSNLQYVDLSGNRIANLRALSSVGLAWLDVSYQGIVLPVAEVGIEVPFVVYDVDGEMQSLEIVEGVGTYEDGIIIWNEEGFSEWSWTSENGTAFNGSVMQDVVEELLDDDEEEYGEDDEVEEEDNEAIEVDEAEEEIDESEGEENPSIESDEYEDMDEEDTAGRLPQMGYEAAISIIVLVGIALVSIGFVLRSRREKDHRKT